MDIPTHALTSFALARGFFPRRGWPIVVGMLVAGTIADVDQLSVFFGPAAYLAAHRTWTHSVLATLIIVAIAAAITFSSTKQRPFRCVRFWPPPSPRLPRTSFWISSSPLAKRCSGLSALPASPPIIFRASIHGFSHCCWPEFYCRNFSAWSVRKSAQNTKHLVAATARSLLSP